MKKENIIEIFIASRFTNELEPYRTSIKEVIETFTQTKFKQKVTYISLDESSPTFAKTVTERCEEAVRKSICMILLINDDYGENCPEDEHSYTYLEYKKARDLGLPIHVYFLGEEFSRPLAIKSTRIQEWYEEINTKQTRDSGKKERELIAHEVLFEDSKTEFKEKIKKALEEELDRKVYHPTLYMRDINDLNGYDELSNYRQSDTQEVKLFLEKNSENCAWFHIYAPMGYGKSTLLAHTFMELSQIDEDGIIYFVGNSKQSYDKSIKGLYDLLKKYLYAFTFHAYGTPRDEIEKISSCDDSWDEKLSQLKDVYIHHREEQKPINIYIDSIDQIENMGEFLDKVFGKTKLGFNFITTSREKIEYSILAHINKDFENVKANVNKDNRSIGKHLNLLNNESSIDLLTNGLHNEQHHKYINIVLEKAKGNPLYMHHVIKKINEDSGAHDIESYINILPGSLNALYDLEFKKIKENKSAWKLLLLLYWYKQPIDRDTILEFVDYDAKELTKAIDVIYMFLGENKNIHIQFHHQSVYEALFLYTSEANGKLIGIELNHRTVDNLCQWNDDKKRLLQYGGVGSAISDVKVMLPRHPLYDTLKQLTQRLMQVGNNSLISMDIYYSFAITQYFLMDIDNLKKVSFEDILYKKRENVLLELFTVKLLEIYKNLNGMSIDDQRSVSNKLSQITLLTGVPTLQVYSYRQSLWYESTYFLRTIKSNKTISKELYNQLNSKNIISYAQTAFSIDDKSLEELCVYVENGKTILYEGRKKPKVLAGKIYEQARVLAKNYIKPDKAYSSIAGYITGLKNKDIYALFIQWMDNEKYKKVPKRQLESLRIDCVLLNIKNTHELSPEIYIKSDEQTKENIHKYLRLHKEYQNRGVDVLFENMTLFPKSVQILEQKDEETFFNKLMLTDVDYLAKVAILRYLSTISNNHSLLKKIYDFIEDKQSYRGDFSELLYIVGKLNDKKLLNILFDKILNFEFKQEENKKINELLKNSVSKNDRLLSLYENNMKNNDIVERWIKDDLLNFESIKKYALNAKYPDPVYKRAVFSLSKEDCIRLLDKKTYLNKWIELRDFYEKHEVNQLCTDLKKMKIEEAMEFIYYFVESKPKRDFTFDNTFIELIFKLILEQKQCKNENKILQKLFKHKNIKVLLAENETLLEEIKKYPKNYKARTELNRYYVQQIQDKEGLEIFLKSVSTRQREQLVTEWYRHNDTALADQVLPFNRGRILLYEALESNNEELKKIRLKEFVAYGFDKNEKNKQDWYETVQTTLVTKYEKYTKIDTKDTLQALGLGKDAPHLARFMQLKYFEHKKKFNTKYLENLFEFVSVYIELYVVDVFKPEDLEKLEEYELIAYLFQINMLLEEADVIGDDEKAEMYEEEIKTVIESIELIASNKENYQWLNESQIFKDFDPFNFKYSRDEKSIISLIFTDYKKFYKTLKSIDDIDEVENLMSLIRENDDTFEALQNNTHIKSKRLLKVKYLDKFEPRAAL